MTLLATQAKPIHSRVHCSAYSPCAEERAGLLLNYCCGRNMEARDDCWRCEVLRKMSQRQPAANIRTFDSTVRVDKPWHLARRSRVYQVMDYGLQTHGRQPIQRPPQAQRMCSIPTAQHQQPASYVTRYAGCTG